MATDSAGSERYYRRVTYHDREYQDYSLRHQTYLAPIDLEEETRLRDQHEMLKMIYHDWSNCLHPDFMGEPECILDCGFGSGNWVCDIAEYDSDCRAIGVDICPLMEPPDHPDNMDLQIANLNETFDFAEPETFDLVHSRFVAGGIMSTRWPNYLRDMYRVLRSGGWALIIEWDFVFRSALGDTDSLQALQEWSRLYTQSLSLTNRPEGRKSTRVTQDCEDWMRTAGFINVSSDIRDVPTCAWPADPHRRSIGEINLPNMRDLIYSLALYPVTHRQVRSVADFQALVNMACEELGNASARPYIRLQAWFGRKP